MCVLSSTHGLRGGGALDAAQFDTIGAAAEECDAAVETGVMPIGVSR
jgi:hypothetical protein